MRTPFSAVSSPSALSRHSSSCRPASVRSQPCRHGWELPDGIRRHGRVEGYALLVVHFEPHGADGKAAQPASPSSWRRFERALQLPGAFAALLSGELGLATSGEPPAQAGIRLEATRDMTELLDITDLTTLPVHIG
jgi:hypothetical protein